jgi:hypothetical protein
MNITKLLKMTPTLILIASLGHASYSLHGSLPARASVQADVAKGLDMVEGLLASGTATAERLIGEFRDPFQVGGTPKPKPDAAESHKDVPANPPADPLADLVRGMTLDATFFQGRDQLAIIDGRIYSRGQRLRFRGDPDGASSPLVLAIVLPARVILRGNNRSYVLSYPDQLGRRPDTPRPGIAGPPEASMLDPSGQLAVIRKLLDSPLGALGRSIVGESNLAEPRTGNAQASRRRRSQGPRAGSGATRSDNP